MSKTKIGVTGGAGFIGSHVCDELISNGFTPLIFDHSKVRAGECAHEVMLGDVRDETEVMELAAHVDGIIHLAAVLGTQETIANPWPAAETNTLGMINVLNACHLYKIPLVYAGVGNFQMMNTYSTTKTAAERLLNQYRDNLGVKAATVRPMNAFGPRQKVAPPFGPAKVRKIAPAFICRALSGLPIELYGDGSQISDMVWVGDVAKVFVRALTSLSLSVPKYPIEVGPEKSMSVLEVAQLVKELSGSDSPITMLPMRPGEMSSGALDSSALIKLRQHVVDLGVDESLAHQALRPLSSIVCADTGSMKQIGMSASELRDVRSALSETIEWYRSTRGSWWN